MGDPPQGAAAASAGAIARAFVSFHEAFKAVARRSKARFERRDWHGGQADARERLGLYGREVDRAIGALREFLGAEVEDRGVWADIKRRYAPLVAGREDRELAETFFNSVTRRLFATVGVDPAIEFVADEGRADAGPAVPIFKTYAAGRPTADVIAEVLADVPFAPGYADAALDARLVAERVDLHLAGLTACPPPAAVEVLAAPFYRNKGAYLVGRIRCGARLVPLVLPLLNTDRGVVVDAVLLDPDEAGIVFSFTRSYFHVEAEHPRAVIAFLRSIMPRKPVSELYISIGYNKHGKTELYRELLGHLASSDDRFEIAPGTRGMVMTVFTLPSFDVVFKIIRDRFDEPKRTNRQNVLDGYRLVFTHDRAGRLVDTQEFEHLEFDRRRFSGELLGELTRLASRAVSVDDDHVVIRHLYTERRLAPLDLYLKTAPPAAALDAVLDYGNAIRDLAAADVFPGDTLLKNFGVTRHGRVVFYDYDEVCLVTECTFREIPPPRSFEEELDPEPWYRVGERDIFPEEFRTFLGLGGGLREAFERAHGDLFSAAFWRRVQERLRAGEVADIFPYRQSLRLRRG